MAPTEFLSFGKAPRPLACICVSRDRTFHLLIELPVKTRARLEISRTAGLSVGRLLDHLILNQGRKNLIDVRCANEAHLSAFTEIVREIAGLILRDEIDPIPAVNQTIRKWKSFWGKPNAGLLSEDQQLGLIGELSALRRFIRARGTENSVDGWKGPLGFRHDFIVGATALEVKATLAQKRLHVINGIDQLDPIKGTKLQLLSWLASRVTNNGLSLNDVVAEIEIALQTDPQEFELFQERLSVSGFNPRHSSFYSETRFALDNGKVFPVGPDFPRLTPDLLKQPLSTRVGGLIYTVNLDGLQSQDFALWLRREFSGRRHSR